MKAAKRKTKEPDLDINGRPRKAPGLIVSIGKNAVTRKIPQAEAKQKKQVLKDFADLPPIENRIELVASALMEIAFKGVADSNFEPKPDTQVHRVWKMKRLDDRQQIAWTYLLDDLALAKGKSGKSGSDYGERIHSGGSGDFKVPVAYTNAQYKRLEALRVFLERRERSLLHQLLEDHYKATGSLRLEEIGIIRSGYKDAEASRVAGVVHIQLLLSRIATFYGV